MLLVGVLGLNFKTADLSLREAIARGVQNLAGERSIFFPYPIVVLSTCNRTEVYFSGEDLGAAHSALLAHLRTQIEQPFEHRLYSFFGSDCFAHLCRVAAGLDSAIVAETEIQKQVKVAYARACGWLSLPACLHYLFQKALKVSKAIRHQMGPERSPTLMGKLWKLADWKNGSILLVGHSEINRRLVSFLLYKGVRDFSLCTKDPWKVLLDGVRVYSRKILERWQQFDIIVCASIAQDYLIRGQGSSRNILFDLSVPRNVDPEVGKTALLYNIDQMSEQGKTAQFLERSEELIWEQVAHLTRIYQFKTQHALESAGMGSHL